MPLPEIQSSSAMAQTLMDEVIIGHEEETWDMADEDKMDEPQAQGKIG